MRKVLLSVTAATLLATAAVPMENAIGALKARYSRIKNVHLLATGEMWVRAGTKASSGDISFEYWANGDRYRIKSQASPALGLADNLEVAFDEVSWQVLDQNASTLHVSRTEPASLPVALPNPLFLPVEFLNPEGDACQGCRLKLTDLSRETVWSKSLQTSPSGRIEARTQGTGHIAYETRFETVEGTAAPALITRIDNGVKTLEIRSDRFVTPDPSVGPLPSRVRLIAYAPDGLRQIMGATFNIEVLEINQDLPESAFGISRERVKKVWDSDTKTFLKHPDGKMVNRRFEEQ